jgi:hypothetical protein
VTDALSATGGDVVVGDSRLGVSGSPTGADAIDVSTESSAAIPAVHRAVVHGAVSSPTPVALRIATRLCANVLRAHSLANCQNRDVNITTSLLRARCDVAKSPVGLWLIPKFPTDRYWQAAYSYLRASAGRSRAGWLAG